MAVLGDTWDSHVVAVESSDTFSVAMEIPICI